MAEKVFRGIVTQFDMDARTRAKHPDLTPCGPVLHELYLYNLGSRPESMQRRADELQAAGHGWVRIAKVIVDIPDEGEA